MSNQVTRETTLAQLISLGLIKASQIDTYNKRLARKASKAQDSQLQDRANQAVACYIGMTFKPGYDNRFRKKPIEKALLKDGISRSMIDKAISVMVDEGSLVNNSDSVNNQCHTRHWRPEPETAESDK
tara:strand:- start:6 stop:389 length:384 start_codon:yes stop_codon:yes gene_type:complete